MKKISVIVPCYNVEPYVEECLSSIAQQTIGVDELEIILVDNGSVDRTGAILKVFESRYPESVLLVSIAQNQMPGYARNVGLSYATAKYTVFIDSDDAIVPEALAELYEQMEETDADILEFDFASGRDMAHMYTDSKNTQTLQSYSITCEKDRQILYGGVVKSGVIWNKIYRTAFLQENQLFFAEGLKHEDTIFALMIILYVSKYATYEKSLYCYRINDTGIMWSCKKNDYGQFDRCKVQLLMLKECEKRGLLEKHYEIIEGNFLQVYYADTFVMVLERFEQMPDREIKEMQRTIRTCFPHYKNNLFVNLPKNKGIKQILETVDQELDEVAFQRLKKEIFSVHS